VGAPAVAKLARIRWTTVSGSGLLLDAVGATLTRAWAALPSLEVPSSLTRVTPGTRRAACCTRAIAMLSAAVSDPDARSATMIAVPDGLRPWKGVASQAACTLGLDDERNWALLDWVTLDRLGSRRTPATTPTIQTATISQRKRIAKPASALKIVCRGPLRSRCCGIDVIFDMVLLS
jgi:hypothetical protein